MFSENLGGSWRSWLRVSFRWLLQPNPRRVDLGQFCRYVRLRVCPKRNSSCFSWTTQSVVLFLNFRLLNCCDNRYHISGGHAEKVNLELTPEKSLIQLSAALSLEQLITLRSLYSACLRLLSWPKNNPRPNNLMCGAYGYPWSYHKKVRFLMFDKYMLSLWPT